MRTQIIINEPCKANWHNMEKNAVGRHCSSCKTNVIDLSKMSLDEIDHYFKNNFSDTICAKVHNRHIQQNNILFRFLNAFESKLTNFKPIAFALISALLFLTGCKTKRHTMGNVRFLSKQDIKNTQTIPKPKNI